MINRIGALLLIMSQLWACTGTESENIRTSGIYAKYEVESDGYTSRISASFRVGRHSNTYLDLTGGDRVYANNGSYINYLSRHEELFGLIEYRGQYLSDSSGTLYTITLHRPMENEVLASSATLPIAFELAALANNYSASEQINLNWSPADANAYMEVRLLGSCINVQIINLPANATSVNLNMANYLNDPQGTGSCLITGTIARSRVAAVNPGFGDGGRFITRQKRTFSFNLNY